MFNLNFFIKIICANMLFFNLIMANTFNSFYKSEWRDAKLSELIIIGAHNAGTSPGVIAVDGVSCLIDEQDIKTQGVSLSELFKHGIRYFDMRFTLISMTSSSEDDGHFISENCYIHDPAKKVILELRDALRQKDHEIIILDLKNHMPLGANSDTRKLAIEFLKNTFNAEVVTPNDIQGKSLSSLTLNDLYSAAYKKYGNEKYNVVLIVGENHNFIAGDTFNSEHDIMYQEEFYQSDADKPQEQFSKFNDECINNPDHKFCLIAADYKEKGGDNIEHHANALQQHAANFIQLVKLQKMQLNIEDKKPWNPGGILYFDFADRCYNGEYDKCGKYIDNYNNETVGFFFGEDFYVGITHERLECKYMMEVFNHSKLSISKISPVTNYDFLDCNGRVCSVNLTLKFNNTVNDRTYITFSDGDRLQTIQFACKKY